MQYEVTFAGFGGQGIMVIGQILASAGMEDGKYVVWLPSYGPEMRGGTAYCTVVIADRPIGSPIISNPSCAVVFNRPSFDKFGPKIRPDGLLLVNSTLIDVQSDRTDIDQLYVPANEMAIAAGNARIANVAMLGAFAGRSGAIPMEAVKKAMQMKLGKKKEAWEVNLRIFEEGAALARKEPRKKK